MSNPKARTAFTLIEMVVALAIITGIVTMVYGSYVATTQSVDVRQARMACSERAHLVLRMMARHVRCAYAPATDPNAETLPSPNAAGMVPATRGRPPGGDMRMGSRRPSWFWGDSGAPRGRILSFVTTSGPATGPDLRRGLSRVTYLYDKAGSTLSIGTEECVDRFGRREETAHARTVLSGVTSSRIQFYDGRRWQDDWDYELNGALPHAVKFEFAAIDENDREYQYGITIPVACQIHAGTERQTGIATGKRP